MVNPATKKRSLVKKFFNELLWFDTLPRGERPSWNNPNSHYPLLRRMLAEGILDEPPPEFRYDEPDLNHYEYDYIYEAYILYSRYTRAPEKRVGRVEFDKEFFRLIKERQSNRRESENV